MKKPNRTPARLDKSGTAKPMAHSPLTDLECYEGPRGETFAAEVGLSAAEVEQLTQIGNEADVEGAESWWWERIGEDGQRDPWRTWPSDLREADLPHLAERVERLGRARSRDAKR